MITEDENQRGIAEALRAKLLEGEDELRIRAAYVTPFYMQMSTLGVELAPTIAALGRSASVADVLEMLGSHWRPRKMGAWYSLVRDEDEIVAAVLQSLKTSAGYLTSPGLATAAVVLAGKDAAPALREYQAKDIENDWEGAGLISAALEWLGESSPIGAATDEDKAEFTELLHLARLIQQCDTSVKARLRGSIALYLPPENQPALRLPSGTRSMLLVPSTGTQMIGCRTTRQDGHDFISGDRAVSVEFEFWAEEAVERLPSGTTFTLWYGRTIGEGAITI